MRARPAVVVLAALVATVGATVAPASVSALAARAQPHVQTPLTITFPAITNKLFGDAPFPLVATSPTTVDLHQGPISGSASNVNDCTTTVAPPLVDPIPSTLTVALSASASPAPHFGDAITLSNATSTVTVPSAAILDRYSLGLAANGQVLPFTIDLDIAGSNTTEVSNAYATVHSSAGVVIHDPDGIPHSGDETADPLTLTTSLPGTTWHPVDSASPVVFTESSALVTSSSLLNGTTYVASQTCGVTSPDPFVTVDASGPVTPLPIVFASLTNSVCSVTGSTVTLVGAGRCTIRATQPGDANYASATPIDQSFVVVYLVSHLSPGSKITFKPGATIPVTFQLTALHGLPIPDAVASGLGCTVTVTFKGSSPVCATYDASTHFFGAKVATPASLPGNRSFPIAVRALAGSAIVAAATINTVSAVTVQSTPRSGYWMLGADGKVYAFGDASQMGSAPGPAVAITTRADGTGYWIVDAAGNVSHFGSASGHGGHPALRSGERISTISATPTGNGYWLFSDRGRAFAFGDAHFYGDMSSTVLNGPVVASSATPTGHGYYMVGSDGGVFSFGDARFHGSTGNLKLNRPVVGISPTPDNRGYWLVASDGGVFAFDAPFRGSMGGTRLNKPVNGLVAYGNGYLMVASDGGIFDLSDKPFAGSLADNPPRSPVIGVAAFSA